MFQHVSVDFPDTSQNAERLLALQVQGELKRKWRSMCLNCRLGRDRRLSGTFASRNGSEHMVQSHRSSRAQSILQSETTVL